MESARQSQGAHSLLQEGVAAVLVSIEAVNQGNRAFVGDLNNAITARDKRILAIDKKHRVFVDNLNNLGRLLLHKTTASRT